MFEDIFINTKFLRHLSIGCISELCDHSIRLLPLLAEHQTETLESLYLCSVKENPNTYMLYDIPIQNFRLLRNLKEIGLDYDYLTADFMKVLSEPNRVSLSKLVLHIHRLDPALEPLSNKAWEDLVRSSPSLKVTLNFIHSIEGAWYIMDILKEAMPVTHLRLLFSQCVNGDALLFLSKYADQSLESVYIIDSFLDSNSNPNIYSLSGNEDPFVMMAWRCRNLRELSIFGMFELKHNSNFNIFTDNYILYC